VYKKTYFFIRQETELDLHAEVQKYGIGQVNMDIQLRAFWRSLRFGTKLHRAKVFLTGATGFLGAFLLRELLATTKVRNLFGFKHFIDGQTNLFTLEIKETANNYVN